MRQAVLRVLLVSLTASAATAQSSSLMRLPAVRPADRSLFAEPQQIVPGGMTSGFSAMPPEPVVRPQTRAIEGASLIAIPSVQPRKFKVNDIISIIVQQHKSYQADGKLDTKKEWDLTGKLNDWFRFYDGPKHLGQDKLSNGKPGFDFSYENEMKSKAKNDREDKFTTRIAARVIDVKPNGNLVLEAMMTEQHDEERFAITLTGTCRSDDVSPDNSVLSSKIAEMTLIEKNEGAVRDSTKRGWIPKLLDWVAPF
ncbi:MAG TPA: flagellar basal body L-ring protein FlgH [Phycisphaerae bacterium]|nr:flagellar basal body L-ring protein FlgH [Phycisphaerae bacterium]